MIEQRKEVSLEKETFRSRELKKRVDPDLLDKWKHKTIRNANMQTALIIATQVRRLKEATAVAQAENEKIQAMRKKIKKASAMV